VSNCATQILIRTNQFRKANKSLLSLNIFVFRSPWHPGFRGTQFEKHCSKTSQYTSYLPHYTASHPRSHCRQNPNLQIGHTKLRWKKKAEEIMGQFVTSRLGNISQLGVRRTCVSANIHTYIRTSDYVQIYVTIFLVLRHRTIKFRRKIWQHLDSPSARHVVFQPPACLNITVVFLSRIYYVANIHCALKPW